MRARSWQCSIQPLLALLLVVLPAGISGCAGGEGEEEPADPGGALGEPVVFSTPDGFLTFTLPERWGEEVTIRESTPAELEWSPPAPERVYQFILTPRDARFAGENLFNLYVYEPLVWEGAADQAEEIGREVTRRDGMVYVTSVPDENPYPAGSVDHGRYERFTLSTEELREALMGG